MAKDECCHEQCLVERIRAWAGCETRHGVRHEAEPGDAEQYAHRSHRAITVTAPTHLVCRTPGRLGAISRHG